MRVNLNGIHELRLTLPGTTTGAIAAPGVTSIVNAGFNGVNGQTGTSYTVQSSDNQKLIAVNNGAAVAIALPQAGTAGIDGNFAFWMTNEGSGNVTLTPVTSTIDGQPSLALNSGQGVMVFTDGTNYFSVKGMGTSGGDGAAGIAVSSIGALGLGGTVYIPISGGGVSSATESDVVVAAPAGSILSNLFVQLSVAPGTGSSVAFTVRKNGADTGLTCTISDTATSANDTAHSVTVAQGDLLDISVVPTGTVSGTPNVLAALQWGLVGGAISSLTGDVTATGPGATAAQVVATHLTAPLPVNQGGTGTATPSLVAGSNVTITGSWPNQTIAATGGGGGGGSVSFGTTAPAPVEMQSISQTGSAITFSNSVLAGDIIAVQYRSQAAITASTISDSLGTTYTLAGQISGKSNNMNVWIGTAPATGVCKVTIGSPGGSFDGISAMEIAGVTSTVDVTASSYNSTSPYSLPVVTTVANDFIFAAVGAFHNADTFTFSGDFTLSAPSDGSDAQAIGYCLAGTAGTYTLTVTIGGAGADNSPAILVAIEPVTPPAGSDGDLYFWTTPSPYKGFVNHGGVWHSFS